MSEAENNPRPVENFECMRELAVDRRVNTWRTVVYSLFSRRRVALRRVEEKDTPHYVDVHEPHLFFVALGAVLLCVADAFFTLALLNFHGSYELNPVMDYFIQQDIRQFFFVKFGLTALGVMFLVVHKNFRIMNRISGYHILVGCVVMYAVLIVYELLMLFVIPIAKFLF